MYDWRARIGVIYPFIKSIRPCCVDEFRVAAPEGVGFIDAKLIFPPEAEPGVRMAEEAFPTMLQHIEQPAKELALANVQVIIQLGGALDMFRGWGSDREIISRIEAVANVPAMTHGIAEVEALHRLDIKKVVVVTPYEDEVNVAVEQYLRGGGVEVVHLKRLGVVREVFEASPYGIYRPIKETFLQSPPADGLIILCGAIRTFEIIQPLEYDIGKPVITAVQAGLWKVLDMVSVKEPIRGYGKLLEVL